MQWYIKVLKNYAVFDGRARRSEYWYFVLFNFIISFAIGFVEGALGMVDPVTGGGGIFSAVYSFGVLIPSIAVGVRRMHDVGKSGWFLLIPIYNFILTVTEGEVGENEYGRDPKGIHEDDITEHLVE
ncbi:MAG: DUF805 domain-containing protein [Bacteroidota bacterium]